MPNGRCAGLIGCVFGIVLGIASTLPLGACPRLQEADFTNYVTQGQLALYRKDFKLAVTCFKQALELQRENGNVCFLLSEAFNGLKQPAESQRYRDLARKYSSTMLNTAEARVPSGTPISKQPDVARPPVSPPRVARSAYVREKWALVVGIGQFKDTHIPSLKYPAKDARDLAAALVDPTVGRFKKDHVVLLTDELATTVKIRSSIEEIANSAMPEDLVLIFLSSHGASGERDLGNEGHFVTYDAVLDDLHPTAIPMREFTGDVRNRIRAGRKVVLLDTCYSGQADADGKGMEMVGAAQHKSAVDLSGYGAVVITSSSKNEQSYESDNISNGYFTYFLIKALSQDAGRTSVKTIYGYLQDHVPQAVLKDKDRRQHPCLMAEPLEDAAEIKIGVASSNR